MGGMGGSVSSTVVGNFVGGRDEGEIPSPKSISSFIGDRVVTSKSTAPVGDGVSVGVCVVGDGVISKNPEGDGVILITSDGGRVGSMMGNAVGVLVVLPLTAKTTTIAVTPTTKSRISKQKSLPRSVLWSNHEPLQSLLLSSTSESTVIKEHSSMGVIAFGIGRVCRAFIVVFDDAGGTLLVLGWSCRLLATGVLSETMDTALERPLELLL